MTNAISHSAGVGIHIERWIVGRTTQSRERKIGAPLRRREILHQSNLKRTFTGQLVLLDPSDEPASALFARLRSERVAQRNQWLRES